MKKSERKFVKFLFMFHIVALIHYVYAFYYDMMFIDFPAHKLPTKSTKFGGKFKYLTVINVVMTKKNHCNFIYN